MLYMRILIVKNDVIREEAIRGWMPEQSPSESIKLRSVRIGNVAMTMLQKDHPRDWDGIMLDYDLDKFSDDVPYKCGLDVAQTIVNHVDKDVPIMIHSMNPPGSSQVHSLLKDEGFSFVDKVPFADMTRERFLEWLALCKELAVEKQEEYRRNNAY